MLFLGIDVGSSSIKLSVLDGESGICVAAAQFPESELAIQSPEPGWAEQEPQVWWDCMVQGSRKLFAQVDPQDIGAIGISYQMHGLVLVDSGHRPLRPAIIWCDSRAVPCGQEALKALGPDYCFEHLLNAPGNFTAAKLRWVQEHEPDLFTRIHKAMLPGDYIAMRLSGEITTTPCGLSEGILWDFENRALAETLLDHWQIDHSLLPDPVPNLGTQCQVSPAAAEELGLKAGTAITYRAGDQANNAFSLNVLNPGEVAATAGTSAVIYGITDQPAADRQSRVNTFVHVTDRNDAPRNGVMVCINGSGRAYSWLRQLLTAGGGTQEASYANLNALAEAVPVGSDGLVVHPFGNGAERIFQNRTLGAQILGLDFNRHSPGHVIRATQEGIVFALSKGFEVLKSLSGNYQVVRAGKSNMFLSDLFATAFANTTGMVVELFNTDGSLGAARGAALGSGYYGSAREAFNSLERLGAVEPQPGLQARYRQVYEQWAEKLPE